MPRRPHPHKARARQPFPRAAAILAAWLLAGAAVPAWGDASGRASPADPIEARVEAILSRMTPEEKIGQLTLTPNNPGFDMAEVRAGRVGAVSAFTTAATIATVQDAARASRLGVPLLVGLDVVHGFRTMVPLGLAEAASFDPALAREAAAMTAREAAAQGFNWTFSPMADLARDVRWGRGIEGFGEDPLLGALFTRARVEGYRAGGLAVTLKHFAGYGAAVGGRDYDAATIAPGELLDSYLPPFRAGIEAGAESVMSAFQALNGEPATGSRALLTGLLRERLGFRGFVVSDWQAIPQLVEHGVAAGGPEAAFRALEAGTDMDMAGDLYRRHLPAALAVGRIADAAVTEATRRVLRAKVSVGLLDRPPLDHPGGNVPAPTAETRAVSRRVARDTIVLLRNGGVLPLDRARTGRIALIGGMADSGKDLIGPHGALVRWEDTVTVLAGLRERAAAAGIALRYAPGCDAICQAPDGFAEAEEVARDSDLVVAVLGEPEEMTGEGGSRAHLTLPGRQAELLARLVETGKPVVVVLLGSRPLTLGPVHERLAGLLMAWFPGTEGGRAIADILFGDAEPSARLPISWPRTVGQVPLHYDRLPTGRPFATGNRFTLRYADEQLTPLYPFGFGLGYQPLVLSAPVVDTPRVPRDGALLVRVQVSNPGARPGREVVQLYVHQRVASVSRPVRQLRTFEKVALAPGESRVVTLRVAAADLGYHRNDGSFVLEPAPFDVFVGTSADAPKAGSFDFVE